MNLIGCEGLINNGQVHLRGAPPRLLDGARLLVVVTACLGWVSRGMTEAEWRMPFEEFIAAPQAAEPALLEDQLLSDDKINVSVHGARKERRAASGD